MLVPELNFKKQSTCGQHAAATSPCIQMPPCASRCKGRGQRHCSSDGARQSGNNQPSATKTMTINWWQKNCNIGKSSNIQPAVTNQ